MLLLRSDVIILPGRGVRLRRAPIATMHRMLGIFFNVFRTRGCA